MKHIDDERREWEQELRDAQGGLEYYGNFQRGMRRAYVFYKKLGGGKAIIPDAAHGLRLLAGILIAFGGFVLLGSVFEQGSIRELARIAVFIIGLVLAWTAFDLK